MLCKQVISVCNLNKHYNSKNCNKGVKCTGKGKYDNLIICPHCSKNKCEDSNVSFAQHIIRCKNNSSRIKVPTKGKVSYKKGRTKETDIFILKQSETLKKNYKLGLINKRKFDDAAREQLSILAKERNLGGYRPHPNKGRKYKDIWFDSEWEIKVAISLDENNILWERPKKGFIWTNEGNKYYPDFYLPKYDIYLDPKNDYLQKIDKEKIAEASRRNNISVLVLSANELEWNKIKAKIALIV